MLKSQILDLALGDREAAPPASLPRRSLWKLILLLSLKDRADEVWLFRRGGKVEMWYRVNGQFRELVPPPNHCITEMVEDAFDLARPRGLRAWLIRRLRSLIRRLEGPFGGDHSWFMLWTGTKAAFVDVRPEGDGGVVLKLRDCDEGMDIEAHALLVDYFRRWQDADPGDESRPDEVPPEATSGPEPRPD